jgi:hypothetical protein
MANIFRWLLLVKPNINLKGHEEYKEHIEIKPPFCHQIGSHLHRNVEAIDIYFNASSTPSPSSSPLHIILI